MPTIAPTVALTIADVGAATPDAETAWPRSDSAGMAPRWGVIPGQATVLEVADRLTQDSPRPLGREPLWGILWSSRGRASSPSPRARGRFHGDRVRGRLALTALSASQHTGASRLAPRMDGQVDGQSCSIVELRNGLDHGAALPNGSISDPSAVRCVRPGCWPDVCCGCAVRWKGPFPAGRRPRDNEKPSSGTPLSA